MVLSEPVKKQRRVAGVVSVLLFSIYFAHPLLLQASECGDFLSSKENKNAGSLPDLALGGKLSAEHEWDQLAEFDRSQAEPLKAELLRDGTASLQKMNDLYAYSSYLGSAWLNLSERLQEEMSALRVKFNPVQSGPDIKWLLRLSDLSVLARSESRKARAWAGSIEQAIRERKIEELSSQIRALLAELPGPAGLESMSLAELRKLIERIQEASSSVHDFNDHELDLDRIHSTPVIKKRIWEIQDKARVLASSLLQPLRAARQIEDQKLRRLFGS